jgi:hypothetical protein
MSKRMRSAWITVAVLAAGSITISAAEARPSHKSYGASSSRSCLTGAARSLLSRIEQKFGSMQIVSTCRPGARIAGTGRVSRHASGNAIDFNAGSRKAAVLNWLIANHRSGGTMTYAHMNHIHVDIGPHFVSLGGGRTRVASSRAGWSNRMSLGGPTRARHHGEAAQDHRAPTYYRQGQKGISEPGA